MIARHAMIIGAMKCGTTALFYALGQHPRVALSSVKEPEFFARPDVYTRGLGWYDSLWDWDPARHVWALEGSTTYAKGHPPHSVPGLMRQLDRELRFIYMVRDPIERIRSNVLHVLAEGISEEGIERGVPPHMIETSNYWLRLREYTEVFGEDSVKVLSYADFREDPVAVTRDVLAFLDLDPDEVEIRPPGLRNASHTLLNQLVVKQAGARGLPTIEDQHLLDKPFDKFVRLYARFLGTREKVETLTEALRVTRDMVVPSERQADAIYMELRDDLARFADRTGVDPWAAG